MKKFLFVFICFASTLLITESATTTSTNSELLSVVSVLRDIAQNAEEFISNLNFNILEAETAANDALNKTADAVSATIKVAVENAANAAAELSIGAVGDCIKEGHESAAQIVQEAVEAGKTCISAEVKKLAKNIESLAEMAQQAVSIADAALVAVDDCSTVAFYMAPMCLGNVIMGVNLKQANLAAKFALTLGSTKLLVEAIDVSLMTCEAASFGKTTFEVAGKVAEIASCSVINTA